MVEIELDAIVVPPSRMRRLQSGVVTTIADSFEQIGQQQPIIVRPNDEDGYVLVAGHHRYAAAGSLDWDTIACVVVEGLDADRALIIEIDENFCRADLSAAENTAHHKLREEIYERLHGSAKAIGAAAANQAMGRRTTAKLAVAYTDDVAAKTGKAARTVRREVQRGRALDDPAALVGTSLDKGEELDALVQLTKDAPKAAKAIIDRAVSGEKVSAKHELKKAKRDSREAELAQKVIALPDKKYGVIYEDFEWDHQTWSDKGKNRHASNHYSTSTDSHTAEEIVERTRDRFECAAPDCVLFMWSTSPHLDIALEVMYQREFEYKTHFVWVKDKIGTGYWNRNKHELLLIGTRGKVPAPAPGTQWESVVEAPRGAHSAKPEVFLELIEAYFPNVPKIELNRRGPPRPGWDAFGNEAELDDDGGAYIEAAE